MGLPSGMSGSNRMGMDMDGLGNKSYLSSEIMWVTFIQLLNKIFSNI